MSRISYASRRGRNSTRRFVRGTERTGIADLAGWLGGVPTVTAIAPEGDDSSDKDGEGGKATTDTIALGGSTSLPDVGRLYVHERLLTPTTETGGEAGDGIASDLGIVLRDDGSDSSRSGTVCRDLVDRVEIDSLVEASAPKRVTQQ